MMKKKILALGLALSLSALAACTPAVEQVTPSPTLTPTSTAPAFVFTRENLPRLDGSTSTIPLGQAVCSVLLGESREAVADLVQFSRTTASYQALMWGNADLLLAAEPEENIKERMKEEGDKWLLTPFATDALAFIVSPDNPVDSITAAQARDIYAGKITNWSELGGRDESIMAFQRNADAGSQVLLQKLVMGDTPLMTPPADYIPTMGGMMEAVREFDGSSGAMGYTVYYYANDMKMAEGLKILKIDGVAPVADSIRDGSYAFLNPYYVAIAKDAAEDSPTRILYNWLLGAEGQALIEHEGYVAGAAAKENEKIGYITNIDVAARTFDLDEIEWLTPEDTGRAAELGLSTEEDKLYLDFPNGFYRYNESTDKVKYTISEDATFAFVDWKDNYVSKETDFKKFVQQHNEYYDAYFKAKVEIETDLTNVAFTPYWITVNDGLVTRIVQQYVP